ncbi:hypothetical protein DYB37_007135 [Aphanomyces astaci]|uniref:Uncharacterized protein n=1 Tax=Aphanomyces astaci TaxID=112090 RepID=A0A397EWY5_APHAT|nr:hypothetical protein DYB31_012152 [Aphanomyces astaci]RHZ23031.1 hypothetical protein DYB26_000918 [Aphanomyces astaci]RHZ27799.1 hypothetical protein DYB37_007135 [Aphanomyces astaci]
MFPRDPLRTTQLTDQYTMVINHQLIQRLRRLCTTRGGGKPPPAFHSSEDFRQRVAADMRISNTTWRDECTDQERESNRCRIETALRNHAPTYEELLVIVSAIDEELLHITSRAKLQYFDSAMDFHRTLASGCTASSTIPLHRGNGLR